MNDAYYYAFKAQKSATFYEPMVTKNGLVYDFIDHLGFRSSRNESKHYFILSALDSSTGRNSQRL